MAHILMLGMAVLVARSGQVGQASSAAGAQQVEPTALAEYAALRAKAPNTADAHWKLGLWCEQKGLKAEAMAEFVAVTQLDQGRESAWKKLGYVKHNGRWTTAQQLASDRAEAEAQRKADAHWRPLLQKWKGLLGRKDQRAAAEAALAGVTDPRAVPSIWKVFVTGTARDQERAIDMLGHIDGERAGRALAGVAIFGKTELVRQAAVETLTRRDPDDVLMTWIGLLRDPIKYELRQVAGPGLPGVLLIEGQQFNLRRFYTPPTQSQTEDMFITSEFNHPVYPLQFNSTPPGPPPGSRFVGSINGVNLFVFHWSWAPPPPPPKKYPDPTGAYQQFEKSQLQAQINRDFELEETAKMAAGAQAQLEHDVNMIESANASIRETNARLTAALRTVAGKDFGEDREAWLKWWMTRRGYTYSPPKDQAKVTINQQVPLPYVPQSGPPVITQGAEKSTPGWCMLFEQFKGQMPRTGQCFGGGTPVLAPDGYHAIEALRPGDLVLTCDRPHGAARAAPVLSTHHAAAPRTLRLVVNGEAMITTHGHPFHKAGSGWTKAGSLRPGDEVLTTNGQARVEAVEDQTGGTVWNLRLDGGASFFVGRVGMLVHDISPLSEADAAQDSHVRHDEERCLVRASARWENQAAAFLRPRGLLRILNVP